MQIILVAAAFLMLVLGRASDAQAARGRGAGSPDASAQASSSGSGDIDERIKRAEADVASLDKFVEKARRMIAKASDSPTKIIADMERARKKEYQTCLATATFRDYWPLLDRRVAVDYVACQSLAQGKDQCEMLNLMHAGKEAPDQYLNSCRGYNACARMYQSLLTDKPDAAQRCQECWAQDMPRQADKVRQICELFAKKLPAQEVCPKVLAILPPQVGGHAGVRAEACAHEANLYRGLVQTCAKPEQEFTLMGKDSPLCEMSRLYLKARTAKNPALCEESGMCRYFMTREPRSCDVMVKSARQRNCDKILNSRTEDQTALGSQMLTEHEQNNGGAAMASPEALRALHDDLAAASMAGGGASRPEVIKAVQEIAQVAQTQEGKPAKKMNLQQLLMDIYLVRYAQVWAQISNLEGALREGSSQDSETASRKRTVDELRDAQADKFKAVQAELTP